MARPIGHRRWAIAEGYIPAGSTGPEPQMTSHETACILNASDRNAHVEIMIYFADREPVGPYRLTVPARRTNPRASSRSTCARASATVGCSASAVSARRRVRTLGSAQ